MSSPAPPYTPAPLLIASSRLTAQELVTHFQGPFTGSLLPLSLCYLTPRSVDFSNNLRYVAAAPELVFERLVGNVRSSPLETSLARVPGNTIRFS